MTGNELMDVVEAASERAEAVREIRAYQEAMRRYEGMSLSDIKAEGPLMSANLDSSIYLTDGESREVIHRNKGDPRERVIEIAQLSSQGYQIENPELRGRLKAYADAAMERLKNNEKTPRHECAGALADVLCIRTALPGEGSVVDYLKGIAETDPELVASFEVKMTVGELAKIQGD